MGKTRVGQQEVLLIEESMTIVSSMEYPGSNVSHIHAHKEEQLPNGFEGHRKSHCKNQS